MSQTDYARGHAYEMPPALVYALVSGTTWRLHCPACRRGIVVDVIRLVESVADVRTFNSAATFRRAKCKDCGGRLKQIGGHEIAALQHIGRMPRLVAGDGSDWRRPVWRDNAIPL